MKQQRLRDASETQFHVPVECAEQISQGLGSKVRWPEKTKKKKKMLPEARNFEI